MSGQMMMVSIPQSGWGGFRRDFLAQDVRPGNVSIPQSGWGGFRLAYQRGGGPEVKRFNPSVGMGWFQAGLG